MSSQFERSEEIEKIVVSLMRDRADLFGGFFQYIFPEMISCGLRVDKPAPPNQKWILKIVGVKNQFTLINGEKKYIIYGYETTWSNLSYEKKVAHVASMLKHIDYPTEEEMNDLAEKGKDYQYGKTIKPDITDWRTFLTAPGFGVGWDEEGNIVPNLLEKKEVSI